MPQHNGVSKKMNKKLIDNSRSMLNDADLSQDYWEEVVNTTCYVVNRSSTWTLVDKTPYETWVGKRNSLIHLRLFGCDSFVHIPKERRQKLDNKSKKCIFVEYKDRVKGYKLWNMATRTTLYIRDTIFRESRRTSKTEEVREKKLEKLEFNWNKESHDSNESIESKEEVETQTLVMRKFGQARQHLDRYIPPNFH